MKRLYLLVGLLIISLSFPLTSQAVTKTITAKPMSLITTLSRTDQTLGMTIKGGMIYLFGTVTGVVSTDGFVQAMDATGEVQWSLPLDNGSNEIATAATVDTSGNIWVVGSSSTPVITPTPTATPTPSATPSISSLPSPTPTALNPDGVTLDPITPLRKDLTSLIVWKVSPVGVLLATFTTEINRPALVRNVIATTNGIAIVGVISTPSGNAGFLLQSNWAGTFGKQLIIGKSDTEINALSRKGDGSLVLYGSSTEKIVGKTLKGLRDGIIALVATSGKLTTIIRSSNMKSSRSWQNGTNSFFVGGDAISGGKKEAVVTKFGSNFSPTWTARFSSSTPALVADSPTSHFALFSSKGAIAGIKGWKPSKSAAIALAFNAKGALSGAYSAISIGVPMAAGYSRELGIVVLGRGSVGVSIFHVLPR